MSNSLQQASRQRSGTAFEHMCGGESGDYRKVNQVRNEWTAQRGSPALRSTVLARSPIVVLKEPAKPLTERRIDPVPSIQGDDGRKRGALN